MRILVQGYGMILRGLLNLSFDISLICFLLAHVLALWLTVVAFHYFPSPFSFKLLRFWIFLLFHYLSTSNDSSSCEYLYVVPNTTLALVSFFWPMLSLISWILSSLVDFYSYFKIYFRFLILKCPHALVHDRWCVFCPCIYNSVLWDTTL